MELNQVKRVASSVLKVGVRRIRIVDGEKATQAMTKEDVRALLKQGAIKCIPKKGVSRTRARKIAAQKKKGKRKGPGKRKGAMKARTPKKRVWIKAVRSQRKLLNELKPYLKEGYYRKLYKMISGGHFRSKDHLLRYIKEKKWLKGELKRARKEKKAETVKKTKGSSKKKKRAGKKKVKKKKK